jgi:tRNA(fMet)-specific endonuclease VapC
LDTNILSELVKKKPNQKLVDKLSLTPSPALYTASICVMELRYGALRMESGESLWNRIHDSIISRVQILGFSFEEALKAGEILHQLRSSGQPIGIEDIMIAAIAATHDLIVVSANTRHFSRIPGLRLENWLQPLG